MSTAEDDHAPPKELVMELPEPIAGEDLATGDDVEDEEDFDDEEGVDPRLATHGLLLWLGGKVPDDLLTQARSWLAEGRTGRLARAVTHVVSTLAVPLPGEYVTLLAELLIGDDGDPDLVDGIPVADADPAPYFRLQAGSPDIDDPAELDELDQVAVDAVASAEDTRGLWRVWRLPVDGSPWPPPKRVYLVETEADADLPEVTALVQDALGSAGERDPQVESFPTGAELPAFQRLALSAGYIAWAVTEKPEIKVAAVFDLADENGPRFHDDHPRIEDDEQRRRLAAYLEEGAALLVTTARMDDVLDPDRRSSVPMNFRTDGTWIWTDSTTYYLREHGLSPDPELVGHIAAGGYEQPELDSVAVHRALAVLQGPADEEPVWSYRAEVGNSPISAG